MVVVVGVVRMLLWTIRAATFHRKEREINKAGRSIELRHENREWRVNHLLVVTSGNGGDGGDAWWLVGGGGDAGP